jgi:hypothetical protein
MRYLALLALAASALLAATPSHAQTPTPDTLDWSGYLPLEVGNHWQYEVVEGTEHEDVHRYVEDVRVVGDTTVFGADYFVVARRCGSVYYRRSAAFPTDVCDPFRHDTVLVRYDDDLALVVERAEQGERPYRLLLNAERLGYRLDDDFGTPPDRVVQVYRGDSACVGADSVLATVKGFTATTVASTGYSDEYAHGVGYLAGRYFSLDPTLDFPEGIVTEWALSFAEVGGERYGEQRTLPRYLDYYGSTWIIPDTLDWRGYYPLEVGNAWEVVRENTLDRRYRGYREIVKDSLIGGYKYVYEANTYQWGYLADIFPQRREVRWIRHDDELGCLMILQEDGSEVKSHCWLSYHFGQGSDDYCALDYCINEDPDYIRERPMRIWGGYFLRTISVSGEGVLHSPAQKGWTTYILGSEKSYHHGVGPLPEPGHHELDDFEFTYVRLGGREYGARTFFPTSTEPSDALAAPTAALYPNPAAAVLRVALGGVRGAATVRLFDVLGREVAQAAACADRCEVDVSALAPGVYFARVRFGEADGAGAVTRRVVVAR